MRRIALMIVVATACTQATAEPLIEPDKTPCQILRVFVAFDDYLRPEVEAYLNGMLRGRNPDLEAQWQFLEKAVGACDAEPDLSLEQVFKAAS